MLHKLIVPSTADGALKVTVLKWIKKTGEQVVKGEDLVELKTEKITLYIPAPCNGTVAQMLLAEGQLANVGDEVGAVEES